MAKSKLPVFQTGFGIYTASEILGEGGGAAALLNMGNYSAMMGAEPERW